MPTGIYPRKTHLMSNQKVYWVWVNMRVRCNKKNNPGYKDYGGRGITYDPKWETIEGFWEEMKDGYREGLTIDRIDNNGDYCKENCRWATPKEQANNRRKQCNSVYLTFKGKTKTMSEWSREIYISVQTLWKRKHDGWSDFKALSTPVKKYNY